METKMKRTLYMLMLIIAATFLGDILGGMAKGSLKWLGYSKYIEFDPGTFINTDFFKLTFGIYISLNVCQLILILISFFVYYKTVGKLIAGK